MKKNKISIASRIMLVVCGLLILAVLVTPIWRIELDAPQYPEGLSMQIHANKLAGNVDIINGLNHYIGMKTLHDKDFPEFVILPWIIGFFSVLFILAAIINRRKFLNLAFTLFVLFGVIAMIDFWRWEYDYGHNLDPAAAIIVPGMSYQPPLIGFKQLLNFGAYSIPDIGGWIFIGVGLILLGLVIYEWRRLKKIKMNLGTTKVAAALLLIMFATGCNSGPQPISLGKDKCSYCKMPISDARFGAEIVSDKGKVFKFDDSRCILGFIKEGKIIKEEAKEIYFSNFYTPHQLLALEEVTFYQSPGLKSPMNGNIAAINHKDSLESILKNYLGNEISWEDMQK